MSAEQLRQLNLGYSAQEDRIRLRLSTHGKAEFRLWLTRRLTKSLMQALKEAAEQLSGRRAHASAETRAALLRFEQEAALNADNLGSAYAEDAEILPFGKQAVLVTKISLSQPKAGAFALALETKPGKVISFSLERQLVHQLSGLIGACVEQAGWELEPSDVLEPLSSLPDDAVLH
jgi:hypothetical protein